MEKHPLVSIVTPSYNQAQFLEETILSVLNQDYPNIEYIIIDGGSADGSVDIIRKYEDRLAYWVSEPDNGQTDAINKGWHRATGSLLAWLNSDDLYEPGAISTVVHFLESHPEVALAYGRVHFIDIDGKPLPTWNSKRGNPQPQIDLKRCLTDWKSPFAQPSVFIRAEILDRVGMLDPSLHFAMDRDLWIRIGLVAKWGYVPAVLSKVRVHPGRKTSRIKTVLAEDVLAMANKVIKSNDLPRYLYSARRQIQSGSYLYAARIYREVGQMPLRVIALVLRAIWAYPRHLFSRGVVSLLVRATVDDILLKRVPKVRSSLRGLIRAKVRET